MEFPQYGTLVDGINHLSIYFNQPLSRSEFFDTAVRLGLPLFAATPKGIRIVLTPGKFPFTVEHKTAGRRMALLRRRSVKELWVHGSTTTKNIAWEPEDEEFQSWEAITERRTEMNYASHTQETWPFGDWNEGEYLGNTDDYCFNMPVNVTDETLIIPRLVIEQIIKHHVTQGTSEAIDKLEGHEAHSKATPNTPIAPKGITTHQAVIAFESYAPIKLGRALSNGKGPCGTARIQRGTPGRKHATLWNPVLLAVIFLEKYKVPKKHLTRAFYEHDFLANWREEWNEISADI
jgi:hypothetical protein